MKKIFLLVTEAFGHGLISTLFAQTYGLAPIAFSTKETKEEFKKEVDLIYNNLSFFAPTMRKATWEEREDLLVEGWNIRQDLLLGKITAEMWKKVAANKLVPVVEEKLPEFASVIRNGLMFVPQKLQSDGMCGVSAEQQSLEPSLFSFLKKSYYDLILGQHFHKVNDLEKVKVLAEEFNLYVPGMTEDQEVFGIRGVPHKMYWNLYEKVDACVGIAGTHTWYLLTCRPEVPQIIFYNKKGVEIWDEIEEAYQSAGYPIYCYGYDEDTDLQALMGEVETFFENFF